MVENNEEKLLANLLESGIITINDIDTAKSNVEEMNLRKKENEILSKTTLPKTPNYRGMYRKTFKSNGKQTQIYASTYNDLVHKVHDFLFENYEKVSFRDTFEKALENFKATSDRDPKTYSAYEAYYKRFIFDDFGRRTITEITKDDLKQYTKELVQKNSLSEKAFLKYKSVLNLTYTYAFEKDIVPANIASIIRPKDYDRSIVSSYCRPEDKIFTERELDLIKNEIRKRMMQKKYGSYYANGYAILLAIYTGMRVGEICALKWCDVEYEKHQIWIHEQQLKRITPRGQDNEFYDVPWTKDEKGKSKGGRYFPIYPELKELLEEIKEKQQSQQILTQYVICDENGDSLKTDAYETSLRRLCQSLNLGITNNHAFRMTLNSLVLIPARFTVTERAAMLGHSVMTNEKYYSFDPRDSLVDKANKLDEFMRTRKREVTPDNTPKVINFKTKKSLKAL